MCSYSYLPPVSVATVTVDNSTSSFCRMWYVRVCHSSQLSQSNFHLNVFTAHECVNQIKHTIADKLYVLVKSDTKCSEHNVPRMILL